MDLMSLVSGAFSGVAGGIGGGLLGLGQLFLKGRQEKQRAAQALEAKKIDNAHDLALIDKEIERDKVSQSFDLQKTDLASLGETVKDQDAEIKAMTPALEGAWKWVKSIAALLFTFVTFIQKTIRPGITIALAVLTWQIYLTVQGLVGGMQNIPAGELMEVYKYIIYSIIGLTSTSVSFWFVTRYQGPKK